MQANVNLTELLKHVDYFADLDPSTLEQLKAKMQAVVFAPGEVIVSEGEAADRMFIIESGEVSVAKRGSEEAPIEIAALAAGNVAGRPACSPTSVARRRCAPAPKRGLGCSTTPPSSGCWISIRG